MARSLYSSSAAGRSGSRSRSISAGAACRCLLVEQGDGEVVDAKMFATGIRTVEFCRRWGIADQVKHWGFPDDFPFDNVFVTSLNGHETRPHSDAARSRTLRRFRQAPSSSRIVRNSSSIRSWRARRASYPSVTLRYRTRLASFRDDGDGVTAELVDETERHAAKPCAHIIWSAATDIRARCARRSASRCAGVPFINRSVNVMFRAPALWDSPRQGQGRPLRHHRAGRRLGQSHAGRRRRPLAADDPRRGRHGPRDGRCSTPKSRAPSAASAEFEIVKVGHWVRRRMVADHYQRGPRVSRGRRRPRHAAERRPRHEHRHWRRRRSRLEARRGASGLGRAAPARQLRGRAASGRHPPVRRGDAELRALRLAQAGAACHRRDARRRARARRAWPPAVLVQCAWPGKIRSTRISAIATRIRRSACPTGHRPPEPDDTRHYTQTSHPGCRAPHAWLADGRSTLDLFGRNFTLRAFCGRRAADGSACCRGQAARRCRSISSRSTTPKSRASTSASWCWCGRMAMSPGAATRLPADPLQRDRPGTRSPAARAREACLRRACSGWS